VNGATTTINDFNNTAQTTRNIAWKATSATGTPGATTLGGTWATASKFSVAAFEIIPFVPPPIGDLVYKQQAVNRSYLR
jgi:hypothetical protein